MEGCDIPKEAISNFNRNFYYNQLSEQKCLSTCYNAKILLHFGNTTAQRENLYWDIAKSKRDYQTMENFNPNRRVYSQYEKGYGEDKVTDITERLLNKTKNSQRRFN